MRIHLFIKILALLGFLSLASTNVSGAEFSQGVAKLGGNLKDGTPVKIEVRKGKLTPQYPYKDAFMWGGDMQSETKVIIPKTFVTAMDIRIGNKKSIVPLSAYSDLGNPYKISYEKTESGFKLIIEGRGGTGTSYKAILEFHGLDIHHRKVFLAIYPDEVWQETTYSFLSETSKE